MPVPPVTSTLASFVSHCQWSDIPDSVRHEAKRSLLNFFAVSLSACKDPTIEKALHTYLRFSSNPKATVIGRRERADLLTAAALNAMSANVFDFDDTHIPTIIHPTAPVAPALFALSEQQPMTGQALLLAFVLGVEVECRLGNAISPAHYARGWHITSSCGVFGSAAAAAQILGLSPQQIVWAFGCASAQAAGLVETLGTMSKSVSVGNAARNGLLSALLAQDNFDGPDQALEGVRGFLHVTADQPDLTGLLADLGETWQLSRNTYKPYPCGVVLNPVIEACLAFTQQREFSQARLSHIERIELVGQPLLRQRTDRPNIKSGRESQVSAQHAVAVSLVRGRAGLAEFSDEAVSDQDLRNLGAKVSFVEDASYSVEAAQLRVFFDDATAPSVVIIENAQGSLSKPLTDQALENKLRVLCEQGGSGVDPEALIERVWTLDKAPDVASLIKLAQAPALGLN
jgi:2-methylcitrate dehydratase PrpD